MAVLARKGLDCCIYRAYYLIAQLDSVTEIAYIGRHFGERKKKMLTSESTSAFHCFSLLLTS